MNKENIPYKEFDEFILRTPLLSLNYYNNLIGNNDVKNEDLIKVFANPTIKEAIYLASPSFYYQLENEICKTQFESKKGEKLKLSFLKYLSRMSSRCTPFGLFAGCSIGKFSNKNKLLLNTLDNYNRHTRLDMQFLVVLAESLSNLESLKSQLFFKPNSSCYEVGEELRYVEYEYSGEKKNYDIVSVTLSDYVKFALEQSTSGILLQDLVIKYDIAYPDLSCEEITSFVDDLVESQILVSELEPSVSGMEYFDKIIEILDSKKNVNVIVQKLKKLNNNVRNLDKSLSNTIFDYQNIIEEIKSLKIPFNDKYLFQTDLNITGPRLELDREIANKVLGAFPIFNKFTLPKKNSLFKDYKKNFVQRYDHRKIELSKALDVEIGISYKNANNSSTINPLIDDISFPSKVSQKKEINWSIINHKIQEKIFYALKENNYKVEITNEDLKDFETSWIDVPDTISTMIEIVQIEDKTKVLCYGVGGSSAIGLIGRFCNSNEDIKTFAKKIIEKEKELNRDKILAEVVHLPDSRTGNVLNRSDLTDYEIPYLAKSVKSDNLQIPLNDLLLFVNERNELTLFSKKFKKPIKPIISSAHNFESKRSLPLYHFLGEMQTGGKRSAIGFDLGPFASEYRFIPRMEYEDLIFSEATWNLFPKDIEHLALIKDDNELLKALRKFRKNNSIPERILFTEGDNELLINLENISSIKMFLLMAMKKTRFKIKEFLFSSEDQIVKNIQKENFTNQFIISFYKDSKNGKKS